MRRRWTRWFRRLYYHPQLRFPVGYCREYGSAVLSRMLPERRRRWKLLVSLGGYALGIGLGEYTSLQLPQAALVLAMILLGSGIWWWRYRRLNGLWRVGVILALGLVWTCLRAPVAPQGPWLERPGTITGTVVGLRSRERDRTQVVVQVDRVYYPDLEQPSGKVSFKDSPLNPRPKVLLNIYHHGQEGEREILAGLVPGRRLSWQGALRLPVDSGNRGLFDYRSYLRRQGIVYTASTDLAKLTSGDLQGFMVCRWIHHWRQGILDTIEELFLPAEAAIVKGLVLGDKQDIPQETTLMWQRAGISHLLSVSGIHIGLVSIFVRRLAAKLGGGGSLTSWVGIGAAVGMAALAGWSLSALRACLTATLVVLLARREEESTRKGSSGTDGFSILCIAAWIVLILYPLALFDVGFQLSYSAVLGILLLNSRWHRGQKPSRIGASLGISLAAGLGTLPVVAWYFFSVPTLAPLANLVAVPLAGLVLPLSLGAVVGANLWTPLARPFALAATGLIRALKAVAGVIASVPGSHLLVGQPPLPLILVYIALLLVVLRGLERLQFLGSRSRNQLLLALTLAVAGFLLWAPLLQVDYARFSLTAIDVGQGDSWLVRDGTGLSLLIDGGGSDPRYSSFDVGSRITVPYLQRRALARVHGVINTHPHLDHIGGLLTVVETIPVKVVVDNGNPGNAPAAWRLRQGATRWGAQPLTVSPGQRVQIRTQESTVTVWRPAPEGTVNDNDLSLVTKIQSGPWSFLLTGDLERAGIEALLNTSGVDLSADVLQIPHHGGRNSLLGPLIRRVNPKLCVISVGRNNFGHPAGETLDLMEQLGIPYLRTDLHGEINLILGQSGRYGREGKTLLVTTGRGITMQVTK